MVVVRGSGEPVTVFAHGLGGGIADTRPFGSGVAGTKVFYTARGHDGVDPEEFDYRALAADLLTVADDHAATRAFGTSMGAGALCRLMADRPDRFDRAVCFLPAVLDEPRDAAATRRLRRMHAALQDGDVDAVTELVLSGWSESVRGRVEARAYAAARARTLCQPSMRAVPNLLLHDVAVPDITALSKVTARCLVLGCQGDAAHPVAVAERLAATLPDAELFRYDTPDVLWRHRSDLRARIAGFLNAP